MNRKGKKQIDYIHRIVGAEGMDIDSGSDGEEFAVETRLWRVDETDVAALQA